MKKYAVMVLAVILVWMSSCAWAAGTCSNCGGTGKQNCTTCFGSGICPTCNGRGTGGYVPDYTGRGRGEYVICQGCYGSGKCWKCHGDRKVTCTYCNGSGVDYTYNDNIGGNTRTNPDTNTTPNTNNNTGGNTTKNNTGNDNNGGISGSGGGCNSSTAIIGLILAGAIALRKSHFIAGRL